MKGPAARGRGPIGSGSARRRVDPLHDPLGGQAVDQGAVPRSDDEARARLGDYFAEVLLLDQAAVATRARDELGWSPSRPSLVEEFRNGSYRR